MVEFVALIVVILIILLMHFCVDITGNKPEALNRAIIVDAILCLVYLLIYYYYL